MRKTKRRSSIKRIGVIAVLAALFGAFLMFCQADTAVPAVYTVSMEETDLTAGDEVEITATTDPEARFLHMYSSDGKIIKRWTAKRCSTLSDGIRLWNVRYAFTGTGRHGVIFRASTDRKTVGSEAKLWFDVTDYLVYKASFYDALLASGKNKGITVYTGKDAQCLHLFNTDGVLLKTWHYNKDIAKNSGSKLRWQVVYNIVDEGEHTFLLRASIDGRNMGQGKEASVTTEDFGVYSARFDQRKIAAGQALRGRVITGKQARYLYMYLDDKLAKSWDVKKATIKERETRLVWRVKYTFKDAGTPNVVFYASPDEEHLDSGKKAAVTIKTEPITSKVDISPNAALNGLTEISVLTSNRAEYLHMYDKDGKLLRIWKKGTQFSKQSGSMREWSVKYVFDTVGENELVFCASDDKATTGAKRTATVNVVDATVRSVDVEQSNAVSGDEIAITVLTGEQAEYLHLFNDNGVMIKTWEESEADIQYTEQGKKWTIQYPFTATGRRVLVIRGSQDSEHYGNGMAFVLHVASPD